jgi:two-component system chemotaxis response regulator CheY
VLNVLIVDDSMIIRKTLQQKFEEMGHTVVATAENGIEAVKMYEKFNPDLVTMDITMPTMNGIEALSKIRSKYSDANVIMVTSHGEEKLVMDAISNGAKGYILKPITDEKIEANLQKIFPALV